MSGNEPNASWSELASHQSRMERRELASVSFLRTCTCSFLATSKPYRAPSGSACILQGLRRWVATGSSFHHATGFVLLQHAFRFQKEIPGSGESADEAGFSPDGRQRFGNTCSASHLHSPDSPVEARAPHVASEMRSSAPTSCESLLQPAETRALQDVVERSSRVLDLPVTASSTHDRTSLPFLVRT